MDPMAERFVKRQEKQKLDDRVKKQMTAEEREAEEKLLKETKKVQPISSGDKPERNGPCPCGSGKKYKKCCGAKS